MVSRKDDWEALLLKRAAHQIRCVLHHASDGFDVTSVGCGAFSCGSGMGRWCLPLSNLGDQACAHFLEILLVFDSTFEHFNACTCAGFPRSQVTVHLHKTDSTQPSRAADLHQAFL